LKVNHIVLVTRNARDKIQVSTYTLYRDINNYTIKRFTGQFGGKMTEQPTILIERGKAKRSVLQQAELEFNSLIKKTCDKGYKRLRELTKTSFDVITLEELNSIVPSIKTDQNGNFKPQLAKSSNDCSLSSFDKPKFCSRKINGVRSLFKWDKENNEIKSISRGGGNYDVATTNLRNNERLIKLFKKNPDLILDGELYVHGWPLQKISGTCRLQTWEERCDNIEYWIYDIADDSMAFNERLDILTDIEIDFKDELKIKILEHILLEGWTNIKKYHDKFVKEGFEGLVARNPDKKYAFGKRNSDWIKVKDYLEDSFRILGWKPGLRPVEDMVFVLKTKDGKEFEAKPMGDRNVKREYVENIDDCIGRLGDVKYNRLYFQHIHV